MVYSLKGIPWCIKPLFGFISDTYPLCGARRVPYIAICLAVAAVCFSLLGSGVAGGLTNYVTLSTLSEVGMAWMFVCAQAVVVERSASLSSQQSNLLQSLIWGIQAITTGLELGLGHH